MPRQARLDAPGTLHHVIVRGLECGAIVRWVKKMYWRNEFWSEGFFSSTVGIDEAVIKRYVEFQEKVDKGQLTLQLDFGFGSPVPRA